MPPVIQVTNSLKKLLSLTKRENAVPPYAMWWSGVLKRYLGYARHSPCFFDSYRKNRITGSLILIEEGTNETVGAGMII
ncbi:MAG: hypothetical protein JST48_03100 [Bacteroidetes bacterium]|nr:hypothetical protein [Bacteroidota bacterium]